MFMRLICVLYIGRFLFIAEYTVIQMYHNSIHSPVDGYLGCLQFVAIVTRATMNIPVQAFVWTSVFISFG